MIDLKIKIFCINSVGVSQASIEGICEMVQIINSLEIVSVTLNYVTEDEIDGYLNSLKSDEMDNIVVMIPPYMPTYLSSFNCLGEWLSCVSKTFYSAINTAFNRGILLTAACAGVFILCEGLGNQIKRVTTHPKFYKPFEESFSDILLDTTNVIVKDKKIITSGGYFGWKYLLIAIFNEFLDKSAVITIAKAIGSELSLLSLGHFVFFNPIIVNDEPRISKIQQIIHDKKGIISSHIEFALSFGFHPKTLDRHFKKYWNCTLNQYCLLVKIQTMCEMLIETNLPFNSIALDLGYNNINSASKLFKKHLNITPVQFRKLHKPL